MTMESTLEKIALRHLGVPTLEKRNRDRLDYHDVSVWQLRRALEAAYKAGAESAKGVPA